MAWVSGCESGTGATQESRSVSDRAAESENLMYETHIRTIEDDHSNHMRRMELR